MGLGREAAPLHSNMDALVQARGQEGRAGLVDSMMVDRLIREYSKRCQIVVEERRGVRSGARRQHGLVVGAGMNHARTMSSVFGQKNMDVDSNGVRQDDGRRSGRRDPQAEQEVAARRGIRRSPKARFGQPGAQAQSAAKTGARGISGVSLTQEGNRTKVWLLF